MRGAGWPVEGHEAAANRRSWQEWLAYCTSPPLDTWYHAAVMCCDHVADNSYAMLLLLALQAQLPTDTAAAGRWASCSICKPQLMDLQAPQPTGSTGVSFGTTALCRHAGARAAGRGPAVHRALGREGVGGRAAHKAPHRRAARRLCRTGPQVLHAECKALVSPGVVLQRT